MKTREILRGFTLIELMIVIAIIAILIAYALPAYRDYAVRTKLTEGTAMASAYKAAINQGFVRNGSLDGLNNDAYGIPGVSATGLCVNSIAVSNGEITIAYDCAAGSDGNSDPYVSASELVWTPLESSNSGLYWSCTANVPRPDQDPC